MHKVDNNEETIKKLESRILDLDFRVFDLETKLNNNHGTTLPKKYVYWISAVQGVWTSVYHRLNTMDPMVTCYDTSGNGVVPMIRIDNANSISINAKLGQQIHRVVVVG